MESELDSEIAYKTFAVIQINDKRDQDAMHMRSNCRNDTIFCSNILGT